MVNTALTCIGIVILACILLYLAAKDNIDNDK